ncbi:universal stress protein UspA [Reticulibacter mediterranei]|uniref:Universal stress protein UspA n=1 Tax=Reticulibacter mediterranei TaxID=2778369 RepID=A0A8J3N0V4_9CHLR|nr:universal stress protein [Reticulibacter mediterranei]GHO91615.1 universal stress protein UspA [Reticulibacter mediterranei]
MWQHILVPLDGTAGAEQALPLAAHIARAAGATLTLLRIQQSLPESTYLLDGGLMLAKIKEAERERAEAKEYLRHIITTDCLDGVGLRTKLLEGQPVEVLLRFAREQQVDLIVMCRHEHNGLKRWASNHTARHLARQSTIPILALHEDGPMTSSHEQNILPQPFSIMVALDGSKRAETALHAAAQLSTTLSSPFQGLLHLVRIIQPQVAYSEAAEVQFSKLNKQAIIQAKDYLDEVEWCIQHGDLARYNLQITSSLAEETNIARTLIRDAELGERLGDMRLSAGYDAIALATHGRNGLKRWLLGSVAERLLDRTIMPVLIVHPIEHHAEYATTSNVSEQIVSELQTTVSS